MSWTAKMRENRYPNEFSRGGRYIGKVVIPSEEKNISQDTENRKRIQEEIKRRCEQGENLDEIVKEIAERKEVREQFKYLIKQGITDLSKVFKNWHQSYEKNKDRNSKINLVR